MFHLMVLMTKLLAFTIILLLIHLGLRGSGRWVSLLLFLFAPIVLTPYWFSVVDDVGFFPWVKLYTILASMCWCTVIRYSRLRHRRWARMGVLVLLVVNIFEAVLQDLIGGHVAHYLVLVSGILLVAVLPHPRDAIQIEETKRRDLIYNGMTRWWIAEYSLWNWAFVYLNFPEIAGQHIAVLAAPFLIGMIRPGYWLFARGNTLAVALILLPTFPEFMIRVTETTHWSKPTREMLVSILCFASVLSSALRLRTRSIRLRTSDGCGSF